MIHCLHDNYLHSNSKYFRKIGGFDNHENIFRF